MSLLASNLREKKKLLRSSSLPAVKRQIGIEREFSLQVFFELLKR